MIALMVFNEQGAANDRSLWNVRLHRQPQDNPRMALLSQMRLVGARDPRRAVGVTYKVSAAHSNNLERVLNAASAEGWRLFQILPDGANFLLVFSREANI